MVKMPEGDNKSVVLCGGSPWGFRIQGGRDTGYPLRISRINPNSKAALEGLKEGDVIEAINGRPANQLNHREAHQIIRDTFSYLRLSLKRNTHSATSNKRKNTSSIAMFRSSTCIEVNSPTGDASEQLPHSTTLIFKSAGRGPMTRKSSGEAVIEGEIPLERCSSLDSQSTVTSDTCNAASNLSKKDHVDGEHSSQKLPTCNICSSSDSGHFVPPPPGFSDPDFPPHHPSSTLASPPDEFRDFTSSCVPVAPVTSVSSAPIPPSERRPPLSPADDDRWKLRIKRFAATVQLSICSSTPGSSPCLSVDEVESIKSTSGSSSPAKQGTPVKCKNHGTGSSEDLPKLFYRRTMSARTPMLLRRMRSDEGRSSSSSVQSEDFSEEIPEDDSEYPLLSSTSLSSEDDKNGSMMSEDLSEGMYCGRVPPHERMDLFCQRKAFSEGFLEQRPKSGTLLQLRRNPSAELITVSIPPVDQEEKIGDAQEQEVEESSCLEHLELPVVAGSGSGNIEAVPQATSWKIPTLNILGVSTDGGSPERSPDPASGGDTSISSLDTVMTVLQRKFSPLPSSLSSVNAETATEQLIYTVATATSDDEHDELQEEPDEDEEEPSETTVGTQTETPPVEQCKSLADAAQQTDTEEEPSTLEDLASLKTEAKSPSSVPNYFGEAVFPRSCSVESRSDTPSPSNSGSASAGVAGEDHSSLEHTLTDISDIPSQYTHAPFTRSATIYSDDPDEVDEFLEVTFLDDHVDSVSLRSTSLKDNKVGSDDETSRTLKEETEDSSKTLEGPGNLSISATKVVQESSSTQNSIKNKEASDSSIAVLDSNSNKACEEHLPSVTKDDNRKLSDIPKMEKKDDELEGPCEGSLQSPLPPPLPPRPSAEAVLEYQTLTGNLQTRKDGEDVAMPPKATPTSQTTNGDVTSNVHTAPYSATNNSTKHSPQHKSPAKVTFEMPVVEQNQAAVPNFKATQFAKPVVWSPHNSTTLQESKAPESPQEPKTPERPEAPSQNAQLAWRPFGISGGNSFDSQPRNEEQKVVTSHDPVASEGSKGKQPPSIPPKASSSSSSRTTVSSISSTSVPSSPPAPALPPLPSFNRIRLPPSQSPTITLLQKAREGHIPKGTVYIDHKMTDRDESGSDREMPITRTGTGPHDTLYAIKYEESNHGRHIIRQAPVQYAGIGPTEQGVPVGLRTAVKEENKGEWYKRMYKSLHRTQNPDEYMVVKYRRQGRIPYSTHSGYMSEPEPDRKDDYDHWRYATLDRRRGNDTVQSTGSRTLPKERQKPVYPQWTPPSARYRADVYRNQPKRIEDYEPGRSSIAEMIAKSDEDISEVGNMSADYWMAPQRPVVDSSLAHPLSYWYSMLQMQKKEPRRTNQNPSYRPAYPFLYKDGYESDSTLVYRKQMDSNGHSEMTPTEQHERYKDIQRGGEIPLAGFRRPAPEKPKENPSACMSPQEHAPVPHFPPPSSVTIPTPVSLPSKINDSESQTDMATCPLLPLSPFPISFSLPNLLTVTPLPVFSTEALKKVALLLSNPMPARGLSVPSPPNRKSSLKAITSPSSEASSLGSTDISILCATTTPSPLSAFQDTLNEGVGVSVPPERPPLPLTFLVSETNLQMQAPPIPTFPTLPDEGDQDHLTTVLEGSDSSISDCGSKVGDNALGVECSTDCKLDADALPLPDTLVKYDDPVLCDPNMHLHLRILVDVPTTNLNEPSEHCTWPQQANHSCNDSTNAQVLSGSKRNFSNVDLLFQAVEASMQGDWVLSGNPRNVYQHLICDTSDTCTPATTPEDGSSFNTESRTGRSSALGLLLLEIPSRTVSYAPKRPGVMSHKGHSRSLCDLSLSPRLAGTNLSYRDYVSSFLPAPRSSERFIRLRQYYTMLDRIGQLEKGSHLARALSKSRSTITKTFSQLASRSVPELERLYAELEKAQQGKEFLFRVKSPEDVRWHGEKDRGLCRRTESVQDLRKRFSKIYKPGMGLMRRNSETLWTRSVSVADMIHMYNNYEDSSGSGELMTRSRSCITVSDMPLSPSSQRKSFAPVTGMSGRILPIASQAQSVATISTHLSPVRAGSSMGNEPWKSGARVPKSMRSRSLPRHFAIQRPFGRSRKDMESSGSIPCSSSDALNDATVDNKSGGKLIRPERARGHSSSSLQRMTSNNIAHGTQYFSRGYVPERTVSTVDLRTTDKHSFSGRANLSQSSSIPSKASRIKTPESDVPIRKESILRMSNLLRRSGNQERRSTQGSSSSSASARGVLKEQEPKKTDNRGCVARYFLDPESGSNNDKDTSVTKNSRRRKKIPSERKQKGETKKADNIQEDSQKVRRRRHDVDGSKHLPFRSGYISTGQVATVTNKYEKLSYQPDDEVFLTGAPWNGRSSADSWMWLSKSVPCLGYTSKSDCNPVLRELKEMFKSPNFPRHQVAHDEHTLNGLENEEGSQHCNEIASSSAGDLSESVDDYLSSAGHEDEECTNDNVDHCHSKDTEPSQQEGDQALSATSHMPFYKDGQTHSKDNVEHSEDSEQSDHNHFPVADGDLSQHLEQNHSKVEEMGIVASNPSSVSNNLSLSREGVASNTIANFHEEEVEEDKTFHVSENNGINTVPPFQGDHSQHPRNNANPLKSIFHIGLVGFPKVVVDNDRDFLLHIRSSVMGYGDCCNTLTDKAKSYTYIPLISSTPTSARTSPFPRSSSCSSPPSTTATSSPAPSPGRYEPLLDVPAFSSNSKTRRSHQQYTNHRQRQTDGPGQLNVVSNASAISPSSATSATSTGTGHGTVTGTSNSTRTAPAANTITGAYDDFSDFDIDFNLDFNNLVAPPPKVPLVDKDSARRYQESEVNIHYRSPIRATEKEYLSEEELRRRQEETMRQLYEVERKKKALQELADMESRRHSDNIPPSQKSPIPLNRYDNTYDMSTSPTPQGRSPEPKSVARALFNFKAQNTKELSFSKGDIILIHRKIDKNWYEGEHHGLFGWFPANYVEIIPYESVRSVQPKKFSEGQARAKFTFRAQSPMELSLVKGETVIITRRVDNNWFEGRVGSRRGIFPVCYVDVLIHPGEPNGSISPPAKPIASPVSHSLILNGSNYTLPSKHGPKMQTYISAPIPYSTVRKIPPRPGESYYEDRRLPVDQSLHIDTHNDHIPYRALYNYQPQNDDELELVEGDIVYVMEKCDDGWYVGTSSKSGLFGTFPGNYVERINF